MKNKKPVYPEISIEWEFDPNLDAKTKEEYRHCNEILGPKGCRFAGCVCVGDPESDDCLGIMIEVDDTKMERTHSSIARIALYGEKLTPTITIDSEYYSDLRNGTQSITPIYHELGHYLCGHLQRTISDEHYMMSRKSGAIARVNEEVEADLFASHYVPPEEVVQFQFDRQNYVFKMEMMGLADPSLCKVQLDEYNRRIAAVADYWDIAV